MNYPPIKQNIYIRKLNGLGQKLTVQENLKVKQLKQIIRPLQSLQTTGFSPKDFNLIFKGKNITYEPQSTLKDLNIPSNGIIHLVFVQPKQSGEVPDEPTLSDSGPGQVGSKISINITKPCQINLRVIFIGNEHQFLVSPNQPVQDLKKKIAMKLNLIHESLVLSHLGLEMVNQKLLRDYSVENQTLISVKFNLQKPQKKKLESRMVSSVTFSDENNEPNINNMMGQFDNDNNKITTSSKQIDSDKEDNFTSNPTKRLSSFVGNNKTTMYKSDINSFGSSGTSKAALMFKNALHQKIVQTQSVVSGSFSQDTSMAGCDPNSIMVTVKNQQQTKQFTFECKKAHQMFNIREKLLQIQKLPYPQKLQISLEEDLFQSIDLNKSGNITLDQIVKKMGKQRAVFIYRIM